MIDVIIIGGGVTGLSAAWHLTETLKKNVLLIEQFPFPNQFGSSAGHSRIIRQSYDKDFNCILMIEAVQMWRDLEKKTNSNLFIQNGLINFGPHKDMGDYIDAMTKSGISAHLLTSDEVKKEFPNFTIPGEYCVLYDPIAGVLRADKCLQSLKDRSVQYGLEFHELEKVLDITVISDTEVEVVTNKEKYRANSVIIATGIWSQQFLNKMNINFPLTPKKIYYALFKPEDEYDLSLFNYDNLPSFINSDYHVYGMSGAEYPGCLKIGDFTEEEINPDKRDSCGATSLSKEIFLSNIQSFLSQFVPKCSVVPVNITTCVIMKTPDNQPIIDYHTNYKNVVLGCGFNGAGFKSGIIHGKLLAELATNSNISYDIKPFSINRFD